MTTYTRVNADNLPVATFDNLNAAMDSEDLYSTKIISSDGSVWVKASHVYFINGVTVYGPARWILYIE